MRATSSGAALRIPAAAPASVDRLFVYGSLRTGHTGRALVDPFLRDWEPATISGELFDFPGGYPGVVLGGDTGLVMGELLHLGDLDTALAVLDEYEGSDYARELVQVHHVGGPSLAWIYVLADPRVAALGTRVRSGEWFAPDLAAALGPAPDHPTT